MIIYFSMGQFLKISIQSVKYISSYCSTASSPQELPLSELAENFLNPSAVQQLDHHNSRLSDLSRPSAWFARSDFTSKIRWILPQYYWFEYDYFLYQLHYSLCIEDNLPASTFRNQHHILNSLIFLVSRTI